MPFVGLKLHLPLALSAHHPLQVGVAGTLLAVHPAIFELGEVTLEEADLVLIGGAWYIGGGSLNREVIVDGALVDGCGGLRNELSSPHVRVPLRGIVDCDLSALL